MRRIIVTGAGGFIGAHLVSYLKRAGYWVRGVDIKQPEFQPSAADEYLQLDLRQPEACRIATADVDTAFALAANMGGIGWTHQEPAGIMHDNLLISTNTIEACRQNQVSKVIYASSACVYPCYLQKESNSPGLREDTVFPADPDMEYGWEKLTSEILYGTYRRTFGIDVKLVRLHGIYGPITTFEGGREKAVAALCRKIASISGNQGTIEMWGDGKQTRSICYVDDCVEGFFRIATSELDQPINLGSDQSVTLNDLAQMIAAIAGKTITIEHDLTKPVGPQGRNSDNTLIRQQLGWAPSTPLEVGLAATYRWIEAQIQHRQREPGELQPVR